MPTLFWLGFLATTRFILIIMCTCLNLSFNVNFNMKHESKGILSGKTKQFFG